MVRGNFADWIHIGRPAVEMNRDDRPGTGCNRPFQQLRIEIGRRGVDVDEDRACAAIGNGLGGSKKSVGRSDHFVAGLYPDAQQTQMQRRGSAA